MFCPLPLWIDGHVSACVQNKYLSNLIPLAACLFSFTLLALAYIQLCLRQHKHNVYGFERLATTEEEAGERDATQAAAVFQQPIVTTITTISPRMTVLESLILLVDIFLTIGFVVHARTSYIQQTPLTLIVFSLYLLLLLAGRNWISTRNPKMYSSLQVQSTLLYIVHAVMVDPRETGGLWLTAIFVHFAFVTALCLVHLTASRLPTNRLDSGVQFPAEVGKDEAASLLSRLTYSWIDGLVWKAFRVTLEIPDLYQLNQDQTSAVVVLGFRAAAAATLPLIWKLFRFFKFDLLMQGAWATVMSFTVFIPAVLMKLILEYLESPSLMAPSTAWLCVVGLLVSGLVTSIASSQCEWIGRKIGAKLQAVLISDVYTKVLRKRLATQPPTTSQQDTDKESVIENHATDGNILNLMSTDAQFISFMGANLHLLWVVFPVQTTIATYLLYRLLGPSGVVGVLIMIAVLPLNVLLSKRLAVVQGHVLAASDARIQSSNELIQNIRIIKYLAWELPFRERVLEKRREELKRMRSRFIWWSISMTIFHALPLVSQPVPTRNVISNSSQPGRYHLYFFLLCNHLGQ